MLREPPNIQIQHHSFNRERVFLLDSSRQNESSQIGQLSGFQLQAKLPRNFPTQLSVSIIGLKLVSGWAAALCQWQSFGGTAVGVEGCQSSLVGVQRITNITVVWLRGVADGDISHNKRVCMFGHLQMVKLFWRYGPGFKALNWYRNLAYPDLHQRSTSLFVFFLLKSCFLLTYPFLPD